MDNDINREINIEQVEFGIDIDNIEYSIEINPRDTFAIELNEQGPQGARGYTGNGIESYELTSTSGLTDTYTITFTNGNTTTVDVTNGRGITSITGPVSVGNVDTYTINYNDSTTSTFTVTNGIDGVNPTVTVGTTTTGNPGTNASVVNTGTAQDIILDFTIPRGDKGETGTAATITVGTVTTGLPTNPASVTNVGTSSAAIFDFTIPKGDTGLTGISVTGVTLISTVGLVKTYRMSFSDGSYFDYTVTDGASGSTTWGNITGTLSDQTDLQDALDEKLDVAGGTMTGDLNFTDCGIFLSDALGNESTEITSSQMYSSTQYGEFTLANGTLDFEQPDIARFTIDNSGVFHFETSADGGMTYQTIELDPSNDYLQIPTPTESYSLVANDAAITAGWLKTNAMPLKQDTLVSGTNIKTINGNSILGSGDITIQSAPDIDGKSITTNSSDELQTVGVIDQNNTSNAIKTWTGTKAQYDAIVTKDGNTLYNITDDTDVTLSLLELLYPVGSIYIGTMVTCPLATLGVGTWQLVASDRVLQGAGTRGSIGTTVNESLPNINGYTDWWSYGYGTSSSDMGAFYNVAPPSEGNGVTTFSSPGNKFSQLLRFDASRSSSTYQNDAPVQQDAYLVNIWERIS